MSTEEIPVTTGESGRSSPEDNRADETTILVEGNDSVVEFTDNSTSADRDRELSLQNQIVELNKKLLELDAEFVAKRAFKELYKQKEDELAKEKESKRKLQDELEQLGGELNETKSQVTIVGLQKKDVEAERQKYQDELKNLRWIYDESIKDMTSNHESEVRRLKHANRTLESDLNEMRESSSSGIGSVISSVGHHVIRSLGMASTVTATNDECSEPTRVRTTNPAKYLRVEAGQGSEPESEKSRTELRMYVAIANAQKELLQDELNMLKEEVRNLRTRLDKEQKLRDETSNRFEAISKMPQEVLQTKLAKFMEAIARIKDIPPEDALRKLAELQDIC